MYSNRIVRTKVSSDFQNTCSSSFKRQQFHTQTGSISPCRITADNFCTAKTYTPAQSQNDKGLKKVQIEAFIAEIEKLNDVLKKKVNLIHDLTVKLNTNEAHLQEKRDEQQNLKTTYQRQIEEQQQKIEELLLTNQQLKQTNIQQQQELENLFLQIEQYNKESQKLKETLKNSQTIYNEVEVKQLRVEINNQKQEITRLQIQILEEKKEANLLKLQNEELNNQSQLKHLENCLNDQQNTIDNQKQCIAQLRKTINLLEQNISDQFTSENSYNQLVNAFNSYKEQQKESETKLHKLLKSKESEIMDLKDNFQSQQVQLEQSNLLVISLQNQIEKLKNMMKLKIEDFDLKKFENDSVFQQPLNQHNKNQSKKISKDHIGTPQNHASQHQQINFIKEQCKHIPMSSQNFEKELSSYKNKMNSPSNIKFRQEVKEGIFNKKIC
ncbi:unnamed protein product [Paramecium pentaurelia]|uniref:Uncharacterized protein n=1 Tax=Paramecium pentaurelia TaxID=43138 RepID=A0A8S1V137_9CILI|nr:unnamed protein product [Paramecium pentaurelia]